MLWNSFIKFLRKNRNVIHRVSGMTIRDITSHGHQKQPNIQPVKLSYNMYTSSEVDSGAPPLVIMHGLLGSKQNWNSISKALLQKLHPRRKIITLDARNHGESPHSPYHSYPHLAEDIVELFKELNIERAAVLGHSMGGRAMMFLALKYPHFVDRAIIVDISPVSSSVNLESMEIIFHAIKSINISPLLSMNEGRAKAAEGLSKIIKDKATVDFIMLNLKKLSNGRFVWKANIESLHTNFINISNFPQHIVNTHQYRGPVLFIGGSKSNFIEDWRMHEVKDLFTKSYFVTLGAEHSIHIENPGELARTILNFLNEESDMSKIQTFLPNSTLKWLDTGHLVQLEKPTEFISIVVEFLR